MNKGHYVCDVLEYKKEIWWYFNVDTITQYPGYPMNVYDDLSIYKKQKLKKCVWIDQIGLCPCYIFKNKFLYWELALLLQVTKYQKIYNILRRA